MLNDCTVLLGCEFVVFQFLPKQEVISLIGLLKADDKGYLKKIIFPYELTDFYVDIENFCPVFWDLVH